jgi:hypothetical protein
LLQAILLWAYDLIVTQGRDDLCISYCASTQELVKQTLDEFRAALPEEHRVEVAWAFGFDRVRSVNRLDEQIELAVALKAPVVAVADVLGNSITFFWRMCVEAQGLLSSDQKRRDALLVACRRFCLWLLAVQHAFLDVQYYSVVHEHQKKLCDQMQMRFFTVDYAMKRGGTHAVKKIIDLIIGKFCCSMNLRMYRSSSWVRCLALMWMLPFWQVISIRRSLMFGLVNNLEEMSWCRGGLTDLIRWSGTHLMRVGV